MEVPEEIKNRTTIRSSNPTSGYIFKGNKITVCTPMFIAAFFTLAMVWKQPLCPLTDEWIKKISYICDEMLFILIKEGNPCICNNVDE